VLESFAIILVNSRIDGIISQNDFVNATLESNPANKYFGVYMNNSSATVSKNTFSNMFRALDMTSNSGASSFENNEIEYTQSTYGGNLTAIRITDVISSPMIIEGNNIEYSSTGTGSSTRYGIYVETGANLVITANEISGFTTGIFMSVAAFNEVSENTIKDASDFGIVVQSAWDIDVLHNVVSNVRGTGIAINNCNNQIDVTGNDVNMGSFNNTVGISYQLTSGGPQQGGAYQANSLKFSDNCITDAHTAMYFKTTANNVDIPRVRNNHLYNYTAFGLYNDKFEGQLGTCANYPNDPGRNSFISNYRSPFGSAMDVASVNGTISLMGNSANLTISFPTVLVNTSCNTTSNASCGKQIGNNERGGRLAGPLSQRVLFKKHIETNYPLQLVGNDYLLNANYQQAISEMPAAAKYDYMVSIMDILMDNESYAELSKFYSQAVDANLVTGNEAQWLAYRYYFNKEAYQAAETQLMGIMPQNVDESELIQIARTNIRLLENNSLNSAEIQQLKAIDGRQGTYASVARDLLQATIGQHDYIFTEVSRLAPDIDEGLASVLLDEDMLEVYPNPTSNQLFIRYYSSETIEDLSLKIYDPIGSLLGEYEMDYNNGQMSVDLTKYQSGTYIIAILKGKEVLKHTKVIKF